VKQMIRGGELVAGKHFYFAYIMDEARGIAIPHSKYDFSFKLSVKEFQAKRSIVKKMYGFRMNSFENRSCSRVETFSA